MSVKDDLGNVVSGTVDQRVGVSGTVLNGFAKKMGEEHKGFCLVWSGKIFVNPVRDSFVDGRAIEAHAVGGTETCKMPVAVGEGVVDAFWENLLVERVIRLGGMVVIAELHVDRCQVQCSSRARRRGGRVGFFRRDRRGGGRISEPRFS